MWYTSRPTPTTCTTLPMQAPNWLPANWDTRLQQARLSANGPDARAALAAASAGGARTLALDLDAGLRLLDAAQLLDEWVAAAVLTEAASPWRPIRLWSDFAQATPCQTMSPFRFT